MRLNHLRFRLKLLIVYVYLFNSGWIKLLNIFILRISTHLDSFRSSSLLNIFTYNVFGKKLFLLKSQKVSKESSVNNCPITPQKSTKNINSHVLPVVKSQQTSTNQEVLTKILQKKRNPEKQLIFSTIWFRIICFEIHKFSKVKRADKKT